MLDGFESLVEGAKTLGGLDTIKVNVFDGDTETEED
jgi:hypothetical protein